MDDHPSSEASQDLPPSGAEAGQDAPQSLVQSGREDRRRARNSLAEQRAQLDASEEELIEQVHQIAAELTRERGAVSSAQYAGEVGLREQIAELRELLAGQTERLTSLMQQVEALTAQLARWGAELEAARHSHAILVRAPGSPDVAGVASSGQPHTTERAGEHTVGADDLAELERLRNEREHWIQRLAEAETNGSSEEEKLERDDLQRRLEMALDELRALKRTNSELEAKLDDVPSKGGASHVGQQSGEGPLDWEAQKRRMMSTLESDFDEDNEEDRAERVSVEGAMRITNEIVAEKDREIAELRELVAQQPVNVEPVAEEPSAFVEDLNKDEVIQQERKKLQLLQTEWSDKLRTAEVDLSVERAKIARDRLELEERTRTLQELAARASAAGDEGPNKATKSARGRWMARLGLKDSDEP